MNKATNRQGFNTRAIHAGPLLRKGVRGFRSTWTDTMGSRSGQERMCGICGMCGS